MKAYRILGTTDDVTTCDLCGRDELKGTVVLVPLDVDGNEDGEVSYFGTSCAAKAAGWTVREVNAGVKAAKAEAQTAERNRVIAEREEEKKAYTAWVTETYGAGTELKDAVQQYGAAGLWAQFRAARDAANEAPAKEAAKPGARRLTIEPRGTVYRNDGSMVQWTRVINGNVYHFMLMAPSDYWRTGVTCKVSRHPYGNLAAKTVIHEDMKVTEYVTPVALAA